MYIRKPKFMRSETAMNAYKLCIESYFKILGYDPEGLMSSEEILEILKKIDYCISKGQKAGGFFRRKDFIEYICGDL